MSLNELSFRATSLDFRLVEESSIPSVSIYLGISLTTRNNAWNLILKIVNA
jgi:hypothetical protein